MKIQQTNKLWGAAFENEPSEAVISFTAGRDVAGVPPADAALLPYDLWVNKAHAVMLAKTKIVPAADAAKILAALLELEILVKKGKFTLDPTKEDVHTNIESYLTAKLGIDVAGKLHTARSRNDQVVADTKLYLKDQILVFVDNTIVLIHELLALATKHASVPFPGFTHHQHAMVTTFGHVMAGFASMFIRDIERFKAVYALHNQSPLGNAASYGTSFPIDKTMTATLLGFDGPDHHSMDAITNRWEEEADFVFAVSVLMNHLSILAETLILMTTPEFGMVTLSDGYSMGSSIMPQKKNPSTLEVMKAKAAYVGGQLISLLSLGKGAFIGYNNDSQWAKYLLMDCVSECLAAPMVMSGVLATMTIHADVMTKWCTKGFIGATTLMEHITQFYKLPMRKAKVVIEKAVKYSAGHDVVTYEALNLALTDEGLQLSVTADDVHTWQDPHTIISLTKSYGGPGKNSMKTMLKKMNKQSKQHKMWLLHNQKQKEQTLALLTKTIESITKPTFVPHGGTTVGEGR